MGKSPTFDKLTEHSQILNLGKFMKFCADFGIVGRENQPHKVSKSKISQIFKQVATNGQYLDDRQFLAALDKIADHMINT